MRFLLVAELDMETANAAIRDGSVGDTIQSIVQDLKPEAVYFGLQNGNRAIHMVINIDDASMLPLVAEPLFLSFNAKLTATPVFTLEELGKSRTAMEANAKKYA